MITVRAPTVKSGLVTGIDPLGAMERELARVARPARDRLEQERVVIARVPAREDTADEPVLAAIEDRHALRSLVPLAAGELVDLVGRLATEQLGEVIRVGRNGVHPEHGRVAASPVGAVLVREA